MKYSIYKLTSPSGKCYIGYTKGRVSIRFRQHVTCWKAWVKSGRDRKASTKLYYAFDKYPPENWIVSVVTETDEYELAQLQEAAHITELDTILNGYNTIPGGFGGKGKSLTVNHKADISSARKAYYQTEAGKEWLKQLAETKKSSPPYKPSTWHITHPDGTIEVCHNLMEWLNSKGMNAHSGRSRFSEVGHYKGYKATKI